MTLTEQRQKFLDYLGEESGSDTWTTAEIDRWLTTSQRWLTQKYDLYTKVMAIPVSAQTPYYARSLCVPILASGEKQVSIAATQFQKSNSALITSVTDDTDAQFVSVAHGLSTDDQIQLYNSSDPTDYPNTRYTVTVVDVDTLEFTNDAETKLQYTNDATGTWVVIDSHKRAPLLKQNREIILAQFWTPGKPTTGMVPRGTAFLYWRVQSENLAGVSADLDEDIIPENFQEYIVLNAVVSALKSTADERLQLYFGELQEALKELKLYTEDQFPEEMSFFGQFRRCYGDYSYRNSTERSLVINPGWYSW